MICCAQARTQDEAQEGLIFSLATDLLCKLRYYIDSPKPKLLPGTRLIITEYLMVKYFGNLVRKALGVHIFIIYKG